MTLENFLYIYIYIYYVMFTFDLTLFNHIFAAPRAVEKCKNRS